MKATETTLSTLSTVSHENGWHCSYTKEQLRIITDTWAVSVPTKGEPVAIHFTRDMDYSNGQISWTEQKNPHGDRLYLVELWNE